MMLDYHGGLVEQMTRRKRSLILILSIAAGVFSPARIISQPTPTQALYEQAGKALDAGNTVSGNQAL